MSEHLKGQMTIDQFLEIPEPKIDFSCFESRRGKHPNSIKLGHCPYTQQEKWDRDLRCDECDAHIEFYKVADYFRAKGFKWNESVELSKKYHGIESAYEIALKNINVEEALNEYNERKRENDK